MQYILIGHTKGDELLPSRRVILSGPSQHYQTLKDLGAEAIDKAKIAKGKLARSTDGCYSELWAGSVLSRCEVVPLEPGQAV